MPEIIKGPRPLEDRLLNFHPESHVVVAFHSIPSEHGTGGIGNSWIARMLTDNYAGDPRRLIQSGERLRTYFKRWKLARGSSYTDEGFDRWRSGLENNLPELQRIDRTLDREIAGDAEKESAASCLTFVDSKLLSALQIAGQLGKSVRNYPMLSQTLLIIGVTARDEVAAERVQRRELEKNGHSISFEEAMAIRAKRLQVDQQNNEANYPFLRQLGMPYNYQTMRNISHIVIDNSEEIAPEDRMQAEARFIQNWMNFISTTYPSLAPAFLCGCCSEDSGYQLAVN